MTDENMAVMTGPNDQTIEGRKVFIGTLVIGDEASVEGFIPKHLGATAVGEALLTAEDVTAQRSALGLGSAATLNAPTAGNASSSQLVKGDDSRLLKTGGEEWALVEPPSTGQWASIAYGNGKFVAVGTSSMAVMYSSDGAKWTTIPSLPTHSWRSVVFAQGMFVAVGSGGGFTRVMRSYDGVTWADSSMPNNGTLTAVTFGNGRFVAVANSSTHHGMHSNDGVSWTTIPSSGAVQWDAAAFGGGRFVAVGRDGRVMYSDNGVTWTVITLGATLKFNAITFAEGHFVLAGDEGALRYSTDGVLWNVAAASGSQQWKGVTYGSGRFVVVGIYGDTAYSSDGTAWVTSPPPPGTSYNGSWNAIAFGNGRFVAVKAGSSPIRVMYSASSRLQLGLGRVDNTSDAEKPISYATQVALDDKAPIPAHGELTGTTIPWSRDGIYWKTISSNTAFTFDSLTLGRMVVLDLTSVGDAQPTWPAEVKWPGPGPAGITPVHPADGNAVYTFVRTNGVIKGAVQFYS